jgi:hypothetical protein
LGVDGAAALYFARLRIFDIVNDRSPQTANMPDAHMTAPGYLAIGPRAPLFIAQQREHGAFLIVIVCQ